MVGTIASRLEAIVSRLEAMLLEIFGVSNHPSADQAFRLSLPFETEMSLAPVAHSVWGLSVTGCMWTAVPLWV